MSLASLEREIVEELRQVTGLRSLRLKDLMEWSSGPLTAHEGEVAVFLPGLKLNACYKPPVKHPDEMPHVDTCPALRGGMCSCKPIKRRKPDAS